MVSSLKTGRTGGKNWRDTVGKSMWTGGDDRGAEADDRMEHQKKGSNSLPKDPKTQTRTGEGCV